MESAFSFLALKPMNGFFRRAAQKSPDRRDLPESFGCEMILTLKLAILRIIS